MKNPSQFDPRTIAILDKASEQEKLALSIFALEIMGICANADGGASGFLLISEIEEEMEKVGLASPDPESDSAELDCFYDRNYKKFARLRHATK